MTTIDVQFSDSTNTTITSYFSSPQDVDVWPNSGQLDTSDARWKTFYSAQSAEIQAVIPAPSAD
jgi:hypothetical protein